MTETRNSVLAGLAFGLFMGLFFALRFDIGYALIAGPVSGLVFGAAIYFFVTSKKVKKQTLAEGLDGKDIIRSGAANHFKNGEAVGGKLYLLKDKLQFQSHRFNIQNHAQTINIQDVKAVDFYNTLGIIPNGIIITTTGNSIEKFVVSGRQAWKEEIEKLTRF